jgi:hypothetical protein
MQVRGPDGHAASVGDILPVMLDRVYQGIREQGLITS